MDKTTDELRSIVMRAENKWTGLGIPRVAMVRAEVCADQVYQPMLHFVLQGSKTLSIGDRMMTYEAGTYFLVPVDVPATGEIRAGGPGLPYLAVSLTLEPGIIASMLLDEAEGRELPNPVCFCGVAAPPEMMDAWLRLLRLIDRPREVAMLAPG
jgi:hypothetical protein